MNRALLGESITTEEEDLIIFELTRTGHSTFKDTTITYHGDRVGIEYPDGAINGFTDLEDLIEELREY